MTEVSVLIPGLLGPLAELQDVQSPLPQCKTLSRWLHRGQTIDSLPRGYLPLLAELLAMDKSISAAQASAVQDNIPIDGFFLRADPVHFKAEMDFALLLDQHRLHIYREEAEKLTQAFNRHFAEDGLQLIFTEPSRWYLHFANPLELETTALSQVIGRNVHNFLPRGEDARRWRQILNEAQMLFYTADVNQRRESAGQLTINSLWLWGEGSDMAPPARPAFDWIMAEEVQACGLAKGAGIQLQPLLNDFSALSGNGLLVLDTLVAPASYGDVQAWSEGVEQLCQQWLQPLQQALSAGHIARIKLYTDNGRGFEISRYQQLKFWQRGHWHEYIETTK